MRSVPWLAAGGFLLPLKPLPCDSQCVSIWDCFLAVSASARQIESHAETTQSLFQRAPMAVHGPQLGAEPATLGMAGCPCRHQRCMSIEWLSSLVLDLPDTPGLS